MVAPCLVRIGDWQCHGGFLVQDAHDSSTNFPCPQCNTENFLINAKTIAEGRRPLRLTCPCCDRTGSPADYWLTALRTAQHHNVAALDGILPRIGTVATFDQDHRPIEFRYDSGLPSLPSPVDQKRFICDPL
jgi:hypothetical protein